MGGVPESPPSGARMLARDGGESKGLARQPGPRWGREKKVREEKRSHKKKFKSKEGGRGFRAIKSNGPP